MLTATNIGSSIPFPQGPNRRTVLQKRDTTIARQGTTRAADCADPSPPLLVDLGIRWESPDLPVDSPDNGNQHVAIIADVTWGIGAASFNAQLDWKVGAQISIAASFLQVDAFYEDTGQNVWSSVNLSVGFAYGSGGMRAEPTRTLAPVTLASGESQVFAVPPFAHSVLPFIQLGAQAANVDLEFIGSPTAEGTIYASGSLAAFWGSSAGFMATEGLRIPGAAKWLRLTNNDAEPVTVTLMFGLQL